STRFLMIWQMVNCHHHRHHHHRHHHHRLRRHHLHSWQMQCPSMCGEGSQCHTFKPEGRGTVRGPNLFGVVDSTSGTKVKEWGGSFQRLEDSDLRPQWLSLEAKIAMASNSDGHLEQRNPVGLASTPF
ncbi:unnamed protein product, partial [Durusdinium trenchii]